MKEKEKTQLVACVDQLHKYHEDMATKGKTISKRIQDLGAILSHVKKVDGQEGRAKMLRLYVQVLGVMAEELSMRLDANAVGLKKALESIEDVEVSDE